MSCLLSAEKDLLHSADIAPWTACATEVFPVFGSPIAVTQNGGSALSMLDTRALQDGTGQTEHRSDRDTDIDREF